ncbi:virB8 family protein [Luteibacter sp. Lutesp34]|uniref:virB8 family protein n=1 Tax=Luteibacter sp. Lutesp34 TaxID=3243030 RepID=UPI0039B3DD6F
MLMKKNSPKIDAAVSQAVNFEVSIADLARRSERRAWIVAMCASGLALILAGGYYYILPLKEKVPYLILADPYSGTSSLARLSDDLLDRRITASEAVNRSNIAHFVLAREAYDLALTNLRDWPTVLTMASPGVAAPYMALHAPNNPQSPYALYGKTKAIRVKILSIVLVGGTANTAPKGATVRFQRSVYDKQTGATVPLDSKIATMEFTYKPNLRMDDQNRIENPLGFQVMSYRVDNDYGSAPPPEAPVAASQGAVPTSSFESSADSLGYAPAYPGGQVPVAAQQIAAGGTPVPSVAQPPYPTVPVPPPSPAPSANTSVTTSSPPQSAANGGRR